MLLARMYRDFKIYLRRRRRKREEKKLKKKKLEFFQKWLIGCSLVTALYITFSYLLAYLDKEPLQELSIAIMNTLLAVDGTSVLGYVTQNCVRAYSANKYLGCSYNDFFKKLIEKQEQEDSNDSDESAE